MSGYVEIEFGTNRYHRTYVFKLPHYIALEEVENWVIVEDAFYIKGGGKSPYKIVRVVNKYEEGHKFDITPTSYIVDVIRGKRYKEIREVQQQIQDIDDKMVEKFDALPTLVKIRMMRLLNNAKEDDQEMFEQEEYVKYHEGI